MYLIVGGTMKIHILDIKTKKPLVNAKIQLQIRGKDSGFLTLTTDSNGIIILDDKYKNQHISYLLGTEQGQWINATDGTKLFVLSTKTTSAT